ncbi:MAG: hypothetical protein RBS72_03655 [Sedimentisphaerales bacterium]|jgi:hypothetical protein|nr:hypothetical protein [Sedimentisphaerales bacterium]HNY80126.1 hypothetical protein [Sedimentisphaerales bacterium]HOC64154.1 hypothetical protein [Sedimentisphaerales bacterium]HOH66612.1 hypothetical protein [Sedimentisphaerales bacterium]HPY51166.1 hypothetical protein [Sedimentisphaerales bacterium]
MQNADGLTPIDRELEAALGGLRIAPGAISRDRVMFDAGRASARRRSRLWQGSAAVLALALLVSIASRPAPTEPEYAPETVARQQTNTGPVAQSADSIEPYDLERAEAFRQYIRMRRAILERGVEVIPTSDGIRTSPAEPLTRENIDELLSST